MPEGHTIHRMARDHRRWLAGHRVKVDSPQGRARSLAAELDGRELLGTDAYGKHLFHEWEGDLLVHIHLGLFGRFRRYKAPGPEAKGAIRLRLRTDEHNLMLRGPTACEAMDPGRQDQLFDRLGPDPLRADADPDEFLAALGRRRIPISRALLDQEVIAGVGNVYRAEVLHVLGLDPMLPAREVDERTALAMWDSLKLMLERGVKERRIVTRRDFEGLPPTRIKKRDATFVYRQRICNSCGGTVRREELAGRRLWWCPACQPAAA